MYVCMYICVGIYIYIKQVIAETIIMFSRITIHFQRINDLSYYTRAHTKIRGGEGVAFQLKNVYHKAPDRLIQEEHPDK